MKSTLKQILLISLLAQVPAVSAIEPEQAFSSSAGFAAGYSGKLPNRASNVLAGLGISSLSAAITTMRFMKDFKGSSSTKLSGNASTVGIEVGLNAALGLAEFGIGCITFAGAFCINAALYSLGYGTGWLAKKAATHYKRTQ